SRLHPNPACPMRLRACRPSVPCWTWQSGQLERPPTDRLTPLALAPEENPGRARSGQRVDQAVPRRVAAAARFPPQHLRPAPELTGAVRSLPRTPTPAKPPNGLRVSIA